MKFGKKSFVIFALMAFGGRLQAAEPKEDVLYFLTSFNTYSSDKYNIKYSPTELSIKKAIDALSKIADNDFVMLENKKYPKDMIYNFVLIALKEKIKNFDQLSKMLSDYKLADKEIASAKITAKIEDADNLVKVSKIFKDRKNAVASAQGSNLSGSGVTGSRVSGVGEAGSGASGAVNGSGSNGANSVNLAIANMFEAIPTELDIMKAISSKKYMKTTDPLKADLQKAVEYLIKEKRQILSDLEGAFKKLSVSGKSVPGKSLSR